MQVTRGVFERDFVCPPAGTPPTVMMLTQAKTISVNPLAETGVAVVTVPDLRWKRRDIKSVALLAQVISRRQATACRRRRGLDVRGWRGDGGHLLHCLYRCP